MHVFWIQAIRYSSSFAFGASLLGAALVVQDASRAPEVPEVKSDVQRALSHLNEPGQLRLAPPPWREDLRDALDPDRVPTVNAWPSWIAHRRPGVVYRVPPPPPARVRSHGACELSAEAKRGRVVLTWTAPGLEGLDLVGYRIERQSEGAWTEVGRLGQDDNRWEGEVEADLTFTYRVTSIVQADDHVELDSELLESSTEVVATALPTWVVVPRRQLSLADGRVGAQLEMYRWDGSIFRKTHHTVGIGSKLGDSGLVLLEVGIRNSELAVRVGGADQGPALGFDSSRWRFSSEAPTGSR